MLLRNYPLLASTRSWLQGQKSDTFVKAAARDGYRCRSAYKLLELNERRALFTPRTRVVVDLGCCPGSWSEVVRENVSEKCQVFGVDRTMTAPISGCTFLRGDFTEAKTLQALQEHIGAGEADGHRRVDVVLSDMSPDRSGSTLRDCAAIAELDQKALDFALRVLRHGGHFVCKVLGGEGYYAALLETARRQFERVELVVPEACRAMSKEHYLVATYARTPSTDVTATTRHPTSSSRAAPPSIVHERFSLDSWPGMDRRPRKSLNRPSMFSTSSGAGGRSKRTPINNGRFHYDFKS
eukprot:PhM_4_TR7697/c0_g2_i1/m.93945/K02427/rlmE, rrmJ, ftsJ; 23S rRNA (uridine2552-2'-O)-methyltransferase